MVTTFANTPCVDPSLLYRDCRDRGLPVDWLGKANVFRVPAGRGPGTGGILLTREQLDSIDSGSSHQLKFEGETGDTVILRDITLTGSTCIWPSSESTLSAVYLCTLADRRHFLARSGAVGKAYNLRDRRGEYLTATTNGGTPWTWSGLWGQLWLPSEGTAPTLPFTPNGTPENFVYYDVGRWEAVNDFMDRLACQLVFDPRSGSFSVVRLGSADPAADASLKAIHGVRTWDTYPSEPTRAWCPETIQVLFKRLPEPTDGSNPFYAVDIGLSGVSGTESGTVVLLHDDLTARGESGTPSNAGDLTSRANERATDWHRRRRPDRSRLLQVYHDGRMDGFEALHSVATEVAIGERGAGVSTEAKASPDDALETWPKYDWRPGEGEGEEWPKMAQLTARNEDGYYSWVEIYGTLTGEYNARAMTPWANQPLPIGGGFEGAIVTIWEDALEAGKYWFFPHTPATDTVSGFVTIDDQTFAGVKTFNDWVYCGNNVSVTGQITATTNISATGQLSSSGGYLISASESDDYATIQNLNSDGYIVISSDRMWIGHSNPTYRVDVRYNEDVPFSTDKGIVWSDYHGRVYVKAIKQGADANSNCLEHVFFGDSRIVGWNSSTAYSGSVLTVGIGDRPPYDSGSESGYVKIYGGTGVIHAYSQHVSGVRYNIKIDPSGASGGFIVVQKVED